MPLFGKFHFLSLKLFAEPEKVNCSLQFFRQRVSSQDWCAYLHFSSSHHSFHNFNINVWNWIWIFPSLWHVYGSLGPAWDIYWPGERGANTALVSNFENISPFPGIKFFREIGKLLLQSFEIKTRFNRFWGQALWGIFWHRGLAWLEYPDTRRRCNSNSPIFAASDF